MICNEKDYEAFFSFWRGTLFFNAKCKICDEGHIFDIFRQKTQWGSAWSSVVLTGLIQYHYEAYVSTFYLPPPKKKKKSILSTFYIYRAYDRKHLLAKREEIGHLKKCAPTMRSWELVFSPTMLRSIVDVFVAKMQWAGQAFSISLSIFCFKGTLSMTACNRGKSEQYILSGSSIHKIFHYHKNTG